MNTLDPYHATLLGLLVNGDYAFLRGGRPTNSPEVAPTATLHAMERRGYVYTGTVNKRWPAKGQETVAMLLPAGRIAYAAHIAERNTTERPPAVGTVLRVGSPEPPDGTYLMLPNDTYERYDRKLIGGKWREFVEWAGPFVIAPDYDKLVGER